MGNRVCYSTNDEEYDCDDLGALFDRLDSEGLLQVGQVYYEMDCEPLKAAIFVYADRFLDEWDDRLYDEVDEYSNSDFSSVGADARAELEQLLTAWIDKHVSLDRYWRTTGKSRERTVTQEDIDNG